MAIYPCPKVTFFICFSSAFDYAFIIFNAND